MGAVWGPSFLVPEQEEETEVVIFYSQSHGFCHGKVMEWTPGGSIMMIRLNMQDMTWGNPQFILTQDEEGKIPKVTSYCLA